MDSHASRDALAHIRAHAEKTRSALGDSMDVDDEGSAIATETRLSATIEDLQKRLDQRRAELEALRTQSREPGSSNARSEPVDFRTPASDPRERLRQLRTITAAYTRLGRASPTLPPATSALPSLLGARVLQERISSLSKTLAREHARLGGLHQRHADEAARLQDAQAISSALETRYARLQDAQRASQSKSSGEKARELLGAKQARVHAFRTETEEIRRTLADFVDEHLAAMLAAEEIGGPVVGELTDLDEDALATGFSATGKRKASGKPVAEGKRQRRIDEIWGGGEGSAEEETPASERDAAAQEVRSLLDQLMGAGGYVALERDSAVARFLVRAKAAQFHPKDAGRIRLVDFARTLDE